MGLPPQLPGMTKGQQLIKIVVGLESSALHGEYSDRDGADQRPQTQATNGTATYIHTAHAMHREDWTAIPSLFRYHEEHAPTVEPNPSLRQ